MREMIDSGIEWVGDIPNDWMCDSLRHVILKRQGGNWGQDMQSYSNGSICLRIADYNFSQGRFDNKKEEELTKREYTNTQIKAFSLHKGDILVEKSGGGEKTPVGRAVMFDKTYVALYANFMDRLVINEKKILADYMEYWLRNLYYCNVTPFYIKQTTGIQNLNLTLMLAKERIIFPIIFEQQKIATYLDGRCAEIDGLIADIQSEIDVLEQYKRSVITEAVTKGLNPSAEMKDSGITWLGLQPTHWEHYKGKYCFTQRNQKGNLVDLQLLSPTQNYGVIPQLKYEELSGMNTVKLNNDTNLSLLKTIHKGDYCISLRSFQGGFEYSEYEGVVSPAYQVFYAIRPICERYYRYLFKEKSFISVMNSYTISLRDGKNISFTDFGNTMLPYPPIDEQKDIATYLDKKCAEIESVITNKKSQIETLEQYKKSVIFEYVTGKKEIV